VPSEEIIEFDFGFYAKKILSEYDRKHGVIADG
jgi:hypothetical protein